MATGSSESHSVPGSSAVLLVFGGLLIGVLTRYTKHKINHGVPYTVILLLIGFTIGGLHIAIGSESLGLIGETLQMTANLDPHIFLQVFIPALIFESAFSVNFHIIVHEFGQALILAGPGVVINALLTSLICRYIWPYGWNWPVSLMFGAIISATDPVAVVALLRDLGASKRLATLIEAESLLNDGTSFVAYVILAGVVVNGSTTVGAVVSLTLRLSLLGSLFGIAVGLFISYWLRHVFNDALIETSVTLGAAYLTFFAAESTSFHVSGVLAVVFLGLTMSRFRSTISPKVVLPLHHVWHMVEYITNSLLFLISGAIVASKIFGVDNEITAVDFWWLTVLYVGIHVTRFLSLLALYPFLRRIGYGLNWKQATVLWFGALRGAIGLALALITELDRNIADALTRDRIVFQVAGIVFLTLLINGMLTKRLLTYLDMDAGKPHSDLLIQSALSHLGKKSAELVSVLRSNYHFSGAKFSEIQNCLPNYSRLLETRATVPDVDGEVGADEADIRQRLLASMKSFYWRQYDDGMTSRSALDILIAAADEALDAGDLFVQWSIIKRECNVPRPLNYIHRFASVRPFTSRILYSSLSLAVELMTALIFASDRMGIIVDAFPEWAGLPQMERIQDEVKQVQKLARNEWANIRRSFPEVTQAIQTKHAAVYILNKDSQNIRSLLSDGIVEEAECKLMLAAIDRHLKDCSRLEFQVPSGDEILQNLSFMRALPPKYSQAFTERTKTILKSEGEFLFTPGDHNGCFYVITRGIASLSFGDDDADKVTLGAGSLTGAWSALSNSPSVATCQTLTPLECIRFDQSLTRDLRDHPEAEVALWKHAAVSIVRGKFSHMFTGDSFRIGQWCNTSSFLALNGRHVLPDDAFLLTGKATRETNNEPLVPPCVISVLEAPREADENGNISASLIDGEAFEFENAKLLLFDEQDDIQGSSAAAAAGGRHANARPPLDRCLSKQQSIGLIYCGRELQRRGSKRAFNIPPLIRLASNIHAADTMRRNSISFTTGVGVKPSPSSLQHRPSISMMSSLYQGRDGASLSYNGGGGGGGGLLRSNQLTVSRSGVNARTSSLLPRNQRTGVGTFDEGVELAVLREETGTEAKPTGTGVPRRSISHKSSSIPGDELNASAPASTSLAAGGEVPRSPSISPLSFMEQSDRAHCEGVVLRPVATPPANDREQPKELQGEGENMTHQNSPILESQKKDTVIDIAATTDEADGSRSRDGKKRRSLRVFPVRHPSGGSHNELNVKLLPTDGLMSDDEN